MEKKNVCILKLLIILITMLSIILTYIPISSAASSTKIIDIVEITDLHGYLYNTVKMQDRSTLKQQIGAILANEIKKIKTVIQTQ